MYFGYVINMTALVLPINLHYIKFYFLKAPLHVYNLTHGWLFIHMYLRVSETVSLLLLRNLGTVTG